MLGQLRRNKGITLSFVAEKLGIDRGRMRRIENGEVTLPAEFIPVLSDLYGVSYEKLIEGRVEEWKNKEKNS